MALKYMAPISEAQIQEKEKYGKSDLDIKNLKQGLADEVQARTGAISAEENARRTAINNLSTTVNANLDAEKQTRAEADDNINREISTIKTSYAPLESPTFTGVVKVPAVSAGDVSAVAASKGYVDAKFDSIDGNLAVFTSPTETTMGKRGLVGDCEAGLTLKLWTNFGWRAPDNTQLTVSTLPQQSGTLTYNGKVQEPIWVNFDPSKLIMTGTTSATEAGVYTARVKPVDLYLWGDTHDQREKEITWAIDTLKLAKPTLTNASFDYDETEHAPTVNNFEPDYMEQTGVASATAKGDYVISITLKNQLSVTWKDDSTGRLELVWKINAAKLAQPLLVIDDFDYEDGVSHSVTVSGFVEKYMSYESDSTFTASEIGDYEIHVTLKDTANTTWTDGSTGVATLPWQITKKILSAEQSTGFAQTGTAYYTGSAVSPEITNYNPRYHALTSETSAIETGEYTLYVKPAGSYVWSDGTTTPKPVTWTLSPQPVAKPSDSETSVPYSGSTISFVPTFAQDEDDVIGISSDSTKTASALGSYFIKYYLKDKKNYVWQGGGTSDVTRVWKVVRNQLSEDLSAGFAQAAVLTFNNSNQKVILTHTSETYHTITGNIQSDAGTYTALITPAYGYTWNGEDVEVAPVSKAAIWGISPMTSAKPTLSQDFWDYTGAAVNAQNKISGDYNIALVEFSGDLTASEPGKYTIIAKLKNPAGKSNYAWTDGTTGDVPLTWRISARLIDIPHLSGTDGTGYVVQNGAIVFEVVDATTFTYNGGEKHIDVSDFVSTYMNSEGTLSATNAGVYQVKYTLKDTDVTLWNVTINEVNGSSLPVIIRWKITPILLSVAQSTFSVTGEYYYTGSDQTVTISGYDDRYHNISGNTGNSARGYTAYISPKSNYAWSDGTATNKSVGWEVKKALVRLNVSPITFETINNVKYAVWRPTYTYNETTTYNVQTNLNYTVTKGAATITLAGTTSAQNAGTYEANYSSGNVEFYVNGSSETSTYLKVVYTINRKNLTAAQSTFNNETYTYDGNVKTNTLPNYNTTYHSGGGNYRSLVNAGTYNFNISPTSNYAWNDGTFAAKAVSITINPAKLTKPTPKATEFTYNGTEVKYVENYLNYYDSATMTASSNTAATDAGSYTVNISLRNTNNTHWADDSTAAVPISWKINPAKINKPNTIQTEFTYSGDAVNFLSTYVSGYDSNTMTTTGTTYATNAGEYSVTIKLRNTNNAHWADDSTADIPFSWKIKPQPVNKPTRKTASVVYNGSAYNFFSADYLNNFDTTKIKLKANYGSSTAADVAEYYFGIDLVNTTNYVWKEDSTTDTVQIDWAITPMPIDKPTCKYTDTTIQWSGSSIDWVAYAIEGYDNETMEIATSILENIDGKVKAYTATDINDYYFGIKPKNNNYMWKNTSQNRDPVVFQWSIVRKRLSVAESTFSVTGAAGVDDPTYTVSGNSFYWIYHGYNLTISGYNPDVHYLSHSADGTTGMNNVLKAIDVGSYTWAIRPRGNYAWSDGTYGFRAFTFSITKAPLSVVFTEGTTPNANGVPTLTITDSDTMSTATANIGKTFKFKFVNHKGDVIYIAASNITVISDDTDIFEVKTPVSSSSSSKDVTVTLYGKENGAEYGSVAVAETDNHQAIEADTYQMLVYVDRSLSSLKNWAMINDVVKSGSIPYYANPGDTFPVTLAGTAVGTVYVGGYYQAVVVDIYSSKNVDYLVFAIMKKDGVDGYIGFADDKYDTQVTDGTKAFAYLTGAVADSDDDITWENSQLRVRCQEFYNKISGGPKSYICDYPETFIGSTDKVFPLEWNNSYLKSGNAPDIKHFSSGAVITKFWTYEPGEYLTITNNRVTSATTNVHMSLGLIPCFAISSEG